MNGSEPHTIIELRAPDDGKLHSFYFDDYPYVIMVRKLYELYAEGYSEFCVIRNERNRDFNFLEDFI
jgi:hypothetical protein